MVAAAVVLLGVVAEWGLILVVVVAVVVAVETHGNGSPGIDESGTPAVLIVLMVEPLATRLVGQKRVTGRRRTEEDEDEGDGKGKTDVEYIDVNSEQTAQP